MAEHERLSRWLAAGQRRLRIRAGWRGAAIGGLVGAALAGFVVAAARLVFSAPWATAMALAISVPVLGSMLVAAVSTLRRPVDRRGVALVLDKVGETEERLITALHLAEAAPGDPRTHGALAELDDVSIDGLARRLPVRWPRAAMATPLLVALAIGLTWLPAGRLADWLPERTQTPLAEAGERLQDRLAEIDPPPEAPAWPDDIDREVVELAEAMRSDELSEAEAATELDQLAEQLDALRDSLAEAEDALDALEDAAEALDREATEDLAEALRDGDATAAEKAARELQESLSGADPQTRSETAEAMRRAGEELSRSGDPSLSGAGDALQQAAQQARANGQLSAEQTAELADQLGQAREAGQQMVQDREALERAQRIAGAIEGARQQLGRGDPAGRSSQQGGDGEGGGGEPAGGRGVETKTSEDGAGTGEGEGFGGGSGAGTEGHTWEDQGEYGGGPAGGDGGERSSERRDGQHIDDFEKFYDPVRLAEAQALVAGTNSKLHEAGQVDELDYRLTTAEETASVGRVELPDAYREAASAAIDAEPIPPAYRSAVRDYFGEME